MFFTLGGHRIYLLFLVNDIQNYYSATSGYNIGHPTFCRFLEKQEIIYGFRFFIEKTDDFISSDKGIIIVKRIFCKGNFFVKQRHLT